MNVFCFFSNTNESEFHCKEGKAPPSWDAA
jgi:hypothetical protein